jgi:hypothetical protein
MPARVFKVLGYDVFQSEMGMGETKEYLLALFLMLYMASLYSRLRAGQISVPHAVPAAALPSTPRA